ncbi:hypothetical protein QQP08_020741 [Theobroma cacao]|nr:hypothetical protein QQP08_020741 [Theobroma cacao]
MGELSKNVVERVRMVGGRFFVLTPLILAVQKRLPTFSKTVTLWVLIFDSGGTRIFQVNFVFLKV